MTVKEYALKHLNRKVDYFPGEDWFIVGYNEQFSDLNISDIVALLGGSILLGTFSKSNKGWKREINNRDAIFLYPDEIFINRCWSISLTSIKLTS